MLSVPEILENWDELQFNDWYAVDCYIQGDVSRLLVSDYKNAKEFAIQRISGELLDEFISAEETPFYRFAMIPPEEAKAYFDGISTELNWITRKKACEILSVSEGRLSQLVSNGQIDSLGKLVSKTDVENRAANPPKAGRRWNK